MHIKEKTRCFKSDTPTKINAMQFEDSIVVKIACTPLTQKKSTRLLLMLTSSRV